jgi:hypothetical protein
MTPIAQLTHFSCGLACLESYFRDIGLVVTQADFFLHHRDLCKKDIPTEGHYGVMSAQKLIDLSKRYLLNAQIKQFTDTIQIQQDLNNGSGIIAVCGEMKLQPQDAPGGHIVRLIGIDGDKFHVMFPMFSHAIRGTFTLKQFNEWSTTFVEMSPR